MKNYLITIILLGCSNVFMTFAWMATFAIFSTAWIIYMLNAPARICVFYFPGQDFRGVTVQKHLA
ncbi:MAG: hypothetical protein M0Z56_03570 [Desulfobacteraceae bacterium]|nr:hypothetical protein [Desulfobacteraceae bacterium]